MDSDYLSRFQTIHSNFVVAFFYAIIEAQTFLSHALLNQMRVYVVQPIHLLSGFLAVYATSENVFQKYLFIILFA